MVALTQPDPGDARPRPDTAGGHDRVTWLVLADAGPAAELAALAPVEIVRIVGDPQRFRDLLLVERPRAVVCAQPPATSEDVALVASVRRRRSGMRAIHLAPPEAAAQRLHALGLGFDDALTTATPAAELAGRLGLLEGRARTRSGSAPTLRVALDLELDLAAHELRRGSETIHLRPKEYGLLVVLAAHPGRAYTRRQLLDRVWGTERGGGPRTVDVHIRWLRAKIEPDPGRPAHLVTVRGVGYRLDGPQR